MNGLGRRYLALDALDLRLCRGQFTLQLLCGCGITERLVRELQHYSCTSLRWSANPDARVRGRRGASLNQGLNARALAHIHRRSHVESRVAGTLDAHAIINRGFL